ncbi:unnamed protein product [Rangifer tarandus platyrhynchus]|uniref:Uncharacterized protein n=1 Tax=Rangifer tarandus platyrhynchus TaxID=3082113 RepID=A0AC60A9T7_RANTA
MTTEPECITGHGIRVALQSISHVRLFVAPWNTGGPQSSCRGDSHRTERKGPGARVPQARAPSLPLTDDKTVVLGVRKENKRRETGVEAPKVLFGLMGSAEQDVCVAVAVFMLRSWSTFRVNELFPAEGSRNWCGWLGTEG